MERDRDQLEIEDRRERYGISEVEAFARLWLAECERWMRFRESLHQESLAVSKRNRRDQFEPQ